MSSSSQPLIAEIHTRFLHPFFLDARDGREIVAALEGLQVPWHGRQVRTWDLSTPHDLYRDELLTHVGRVLFGGDPPRNDGTVFRSGRYLRLFPDTAAAWFGSLQTEIDGARRRVHLHPLAGVELFLSRYGVGVMSVALSMETALGFREAGAFNYRFSLRPPRRQGSLHVRHPADDPEAWARIPPSQRVGIPAAPPRDAPLEERLGAPGADFTLDEIVALLLRPIVRKPLDVHLRVYTVIRLGSEVDLDDVSTRRALAAPLSGLAQIEEPEHAGALTGRVGVRNAILNRRHWACVGILGAAHLVADQPDNPSFNVQRVPRVFLKYFVPYLVGIQQSLTLHRLAADACEVAHRPDVIERRLEELRLQQLTFAVDGCFTRVSTREALHRYYRLCRRGLDVGNELSQARRAISDLDAKLSSTRQAATERRLVWIQAFVASVYAATLTDIAKKDWRWLEAWPVPSPLLFAAAALAVVLWYLNPRRRNHDNPPTDSS